jgi:hypothetical protein
MRLPVKLDVIAKRLIPKPRWFGRLLRIAAVLTLVALALMVWSVLQPTPMPVLIAMSLGQLLGTAAFAMFLAVVIADVRRQYRRRKAGEPEETDEIPVIRDQPAEASPPAVVAPVATDDDSVKDAPP